MTLTYKVYKNKSLLIHGNRTQYQKEMRALGARWNSRIKNEEPGWILSIDNKEALDKLINDDISSRDKYHREGSEVDTNSSDSNSVSTSSESINEPEDVKVEVEDLASTEVEYKDDVVEELKEIPEVIEPKFESPDLIKKKLSERREKHTLNTLAKRQKEPSKAKKEISDPFSYYHTFSQNPKKFKKAFEDEDSDYDIVSSSSSASNSPSPYKYMPRPITPVVHKKEYMKDLDKEEKREDISELLRGMKKLQKQMYDLQLEVKK